MDRRRLLSSLAAAPVALAGCLGDPNPGRDTSTTASTTTTGSTTTTTTSTTAAPDVSVGEVSVAPELVVMNSPDSITTEGVRGEQFVVATVAAGGSLDVSAFDLVLDGETRSATTDVGYGNRLWGHGLAYEPADGSGWLAFRLPKPAATGDAGAVTWPDGERALGTDALDALSRPPTSFEVREFAVPDSAAPGDTVTATLTVANVGDADGTFVGALDRIGPSVAHIPAAAISLAVPAGESVTWEYEHALDYGSDGDTMRLQLDWRDGHLERATQVRSE